MTDAASAAPRHRRERELVDAAARVFAQRGYSDATVQDVADELGILKGSLYHYIRTKEDLLFRLYTDVHTAVDEVLAGVPGEDVPPLDRLVDYVRRVVEYNLANLALVTTYHHEIDRLSPGRREQVLAWQAPHGRFVTDMIRQAQERGEADRDLDPAVLGRLVFASMIWTHRWFRPTGTAAPREIAAQCADYARLGVRGHVTQRRRTDGLAVAR